MPQRILHDKFLRNFSSYSKMIKYIEEAQENVSTEPAETTDNRIRPMKNAEWNYQTEYKRSILICLWK